MTRLIPHSLRNPLLYSALLLLLSATHTASALAAETEAMDSDDRGAYATGTAAMNDHRWNDAVVSFDRVINAKGRSSDAALYWKAYSLKKLGNKPLAFATCQQLRLQYASSSWNKDCSTLAIDGNIVISMDNRATPAMPVDVTRDTSNSRGTEGRGSDSRGPMQTSRFLLSIHSSTRTLLAPFRSCAASSPATSRRTSRSTLSSSSRRANHPRRRPSCTMPLPARWTRRCNARRLR